MSAPGLKAAFARVFCHVAEVPGSDILASVVSDTTLASARRRNLRSPSHAHSIRPMDEQFIHVPIRAEIELNPETLQLVDSEGSALIGAEPN